MRISPLSRLQVGWNFNRNYNILIFYNKLLFTFSVLTILSWTVEGGVDLMMTPYNMIKIVAYNKDLAENGFLGSSEISKYQKNLKTS